MAAYVKHQQFVEDLAFGVHNFTSDATCTPTVFLTTNANAPSASLDAVLADVVQISYTNLSTRVCTISASGQTAGTFALTLNDLVLSATGAVATFRWVGVYNDDPTSPADPLICHFDYGADLTLQNGESLTIDWQSNGTGTGNLFTIA